MYVPVRDSQHFYHEMICVRYISSVTPFLTVPLSPPLQPESDYTKAKRTPERIEFENSIDGVPELDPEEELLEHNLRASISADGILDNGDDLDFSDSDSELVLLNSKLTSNSYFTVSFEVWKFVIIVLGLNLGFVQITTWLNQCSLVTTIDLSP